MSDACPTFIPPHTLIGGPENIKLLFDDQLSNARESQANARAWEAIKLRQAQNAQSFDHLVNMTALIAGQVGETEGQQTVSPAGTAASEAIKGAVGTAAAGEAVSAQAVATSLGNLATAMVPIIVAAGGVVTAQSLAAILPAVVAAASQPVTKPS